MSTYNTDVDVKENLRYLSLGKKKDKMHSRFFTFVFLRSLLMAVKQILECSNIEL